MIDRALPRSFMRSRRSVGLLTRITDTVLLRKSVKYRFLPIQSYDIPSIDPMFVTAKGVGSEMSTKNSKNRHN